jgi:hypothetical protein
MITNAISSRSNQKEQSAIFINETGELDESAQQVRDSSQRPMTTSGAIG